ncbi:hypothetical protein NKR23_g5474 [Pleurostoma richardsiae]|uniref:Antifreeze protein n=1 Tax=Pleurostoma richardsiae TaxID=41990 RepID=A0AA38RZI6_9PEZI|nr:hypothetical protein NKR23_g5474 [Pleurostoma richardsiae]
MYCLTILFLGVLSTALGQGITLTPTTITRGGSRTTTCPAPSTLTRTSLITSLITATSLVTTTTISTSIATITLLQPTTSTRTITHTATRTTIAPCVPSAHCPTLTATGTACRTCLVPQCTTTQALTRPCGCAGALASTTVNFPCADPDSCNNIGCRTVYAVATAAC